MFIPKQKPITRRYYLAGYPLRLLTIGSLLTVLFLLWPVVPFTGLKLAGFIVALTVVAEMLLSAWDLLTYPLAYRAAEWLRRKWAGQQDGKLSPLTIQHCLEHIEADGHIYLVRRISDGVYKIGESSQFEKRFKSLCRDYGPVHVVALWEVPDRKAAERQALHLTAHLNYEEYGRFELRQMTDEQALQFIGDFTSYVKDLDREG